MTRRLQDTSFDRSHYERPNLEWVCGRSGHACPLGPDLRGECVTSHECVPYREGDRWVCARPPAYAGACEDGPLPDGSCCRAVATCQPRLSMRARRGRTVRWAIALSVGFLALALGGDRGLDFIFPGPVTHQHGTIENDCASCHAAGAGGPVHWIGAALSGTGEVSDSERCLACHNLGPASMHAHSMPATELAKVSERLRQRAIDPSRPLRFTLARLGPGIPIRSGDALACALCHQEHRGADSNLTAITNDQCQVCHLAQFDSFAEGHPALGDYPHERRTRIIFNHQTHRDDYYPDAEQQVYACVTCHAPDATGRTMTVKVFETVCADCHEGDVRSPGKGGIAFLNLPALDRLSLRGAGIDVGQWPRVESARGPSPFVELLLVGDERLSDADRQAVARLGAGLSDLAERTHFEQQAVGRFAWSLKLLLHDLRASGHAALESRLRSPQLMGEADLPYGMLSDLAIGLDRETIAAAIDRWLPDLSREVAVFREVTRQLDRLEDMNREHWLAINRQLRELARERPSSRAAVHADGADEREEEAREEVWVSAGGWYRSRSDASLRYRSRGHADPFVRAWLDLSGSFAHTGEGAGDAAAAAERLFAGLRHKRATGKCALCHSIDPQPSSYGPLGEARRVNWGPATPRANRQPATEFRHEPHFSLDDALACDRCHKTRDISEREFDKAYAEPASAASGHGLNFEPIALGVCAECHTQRAAGGECVACHGYHLGETAPLYLGAEGPPDQSS